MVFSRILICLTVSLLLLPLGLSAHEIYLKNGSVIKTDHLYRGGSQLTYHQFGGSVSIPFSKVEKVVYDSVSETAPQGNSSNTILHRRTYDLGNDLGAFLTARLDPRTPVERANLAVLSIMTKAGSGSGFFISDNGLIVTNRHVVRGSESNNQKMEGMIDDSQDRLAQWRNSLDREKKQIDRFSSSLKKSWKSLRDTVKTQGGSVNQARVKSAEKSLQEKGTYLTEWLQDYASRRARYNRQYREFSNRKEEYHQRNRELSKQSRFSITLADGTRKSAVLYRVSDTLDLALLKLNGYSTPYLEPADRNDLRLGQKVYAIGSPLQLRNSVTSGVISNFRQHYIQTNAEIYPGNSGGALITQDGRVAGVNTLKMITEKFEGLGFAIAIQRVFSEFEDFLP